MLAMAAGMPVVLADAAPSDRAAALDTYLSMVEATRVPAGWTGSVNGCVQGTESGASIEATRGTVNTLRDFAGLRPVTFDAELNRKALAAALMMRAANSLSHDPGPGWPCYTADGDEGAGRSNLYLGRSGAGAMIGYVDDDGVASLGHRRWLLDPRGATFGTGSTGTTNALLVIGPPAAQPMVPEVVAWPPSGHVPWPLVFTDWSAAISVPGTVDLSSAAVNVTVDGQARPTSGVTPLADGYGSGRTLKWNVGITEGDRQGPRQVAVTIGNVLVDGVPRTFTYSLEAFPASPPAAPRFTGSRTADSVAVSWEAAAERGAPVTGYRVVGLDGGSPSEFDRTLGPGARHSMIPYVQPGRALHVQVIPLSRLGSPDVTPIAIPAPPPAGAQPTIPGGGTETQDDPPDGGETETQDDDPDGETTPRLPAELKVQRLFIRGGRLILSVRVTPRANGRRIRLELRGGRRFAYYRSRIRAGRARFNVRLSARHRDARPLRVTISFPGSAGVRPASRRYVFAR